MWKVETINNIVGIGPRPGAGGGAGAGVEVRVGEKRVSSTRNSITVNL